MNKNMFKKIRWWDWLVYRFFFWRWRKILIQRPDIRELMISWLKTYDVLDTNEKIIVKISIEKQE